MGIEEALEEALKEVEKRSVKENWTEDYKRGYIEGFIPSFREGYRGEQIRLARIMIKAKYCSEEISEDIGLTLDEVHELIEQLKKES